MGRVIGFAASLIIVWIVGYFLIVGSNIFIPVVLAIFIWHILNTIQGIIQRIPKYGALLPNWLSMILAFGVAAIFISIFINIISNNVSNVVYASGRYQDHLLSIIDGIDKRYHIEVLTNVNNIIKTINIQTMLLKVSGVFTTLASSTVLIALYVAFLFVEQHYFLRKIDALVPSLENQQLVNNILIHIVNDTQIYLGLKSLLSIATAMASWFIMKWVGVDFAEFWALLIFFLNFIPNIGAIIAIFFPATLAIVQFADWLHFLEIIIGLGSIQFLVGNIIEPRFLGNSLNLSPLAILLSLTVWGTIWGVLGMFLSVPITVMMMIIFAHFEATRPIAILLSQDGDIFKSYETISGEKIPEKNWIQY
ncbi:AI-2E family transporter [Legionella lytica]|uniref:AI-2E family transporter n=1 Tax=Legionella lytica TaxID=96232 RepID=A0ABY4Y9L4_9GAMM|nr:AI-2E family transporter [Legionella lytica]USQ14319.1 AI-2E family transporter [Legionella lytica]